MLFKFYRTAIIRYSAEEKENIVLTVKRSEPEYCSGT
mgnify:FL=1